MPEQNATEIYSRYIVVSNTEELTEIKPFYVDPNTLVLSSTPKEGSELHPAFLPPLTDEEHGAFEREMYEQSEECFLYGNTVMRNHVYHNPAPEPPEKTMRRYFKPEL